MPSVSMCASECPIASECFRSPQGGTRASDWQSWSAFHFDLTDEGDVVCQHFMPLWQKPASHPPSHKEDSRGEG